MKRQRRNLHMFLLRRQDARLQNVIAESIRIARETWAKPETVPEPETEPETVRRLKKLRAYLLGEGWKES